MLLQFNVRIYTYLNPPLPCLCFSVGKNPFTCSCMSVLFHETVITSPSKLPPAIRVLPCPCNQKMMQLSGTTCMWWWRFKGQLLNVPRDWQGYRHTAMVPVMRLPLVMTLQVLRTWRQADFCIYVYVYMSGRGLAPIPTITTLKPMLSWDL